MDLNVDLRACLAGRKDAWDAFVRASAPVIYAAVHRACKARGSIQPGNVDDRVQDIYVRLLRDDRKLLRAFDSKRASLATWLSIISRTVVHEHFQKKRIPTVALQPGDTDPPDSAKSTSSASGGESPTISLDLLTSQQRLVIQMLFDEDMSVEQAAARLNVDPQTIRSAKHKALTRLREAMFCEQTAEPSPECGTGLEPPASRSSASNPLLHPEKPRKNPPRPPKQG